MRSVVRICCLVIAVIVFVVNASRDASRIRSHIVVRYSAIVVGWQRIKNPYG